MPAHLFLRLIIPAFLLCLAHPMMAQPTGAEDPTQAGPAQTGDPTPGGAEVLVLAQRLYTLGSAEKDALTVLAAARLAASVMVQNGPPLANPPIGADNTTMPQRLDAAAMLARAKALAGEDEGLLALIDAAMTEATSRPGRSAVRHVASLGPGQTNNWQMPFYGNARAELAIIGTNPNGTGALGLDLRVSDAAGAVVCAGSGPSDSFTCAFAPAENGYFTITVSNHGPSAESFDLFTN